VALVAVAVLAPHQPTPTGALVLGPATQRTPAITDPLAQLATGAFDAAAGSADGGLSDVDGGQPTTDEAQLLDLTNQERSRQGLRALIFDADTLRVARARAQAQIPESKLSHYNGLGELAFVGLLVNAGVSYTLAGENLAVSSTHGASTDAQMHQALMNSPTHRANILEPAFDHLAVGAVTGPTSRFALAEIFRATTPAAAAVN
jgi:uncharacterized protein YkwD